MPSYPANVPFPPANRVAVLAFLLALVGATGMLTLAASARVETTLIALPVALGLLTHREFWRKAALAYALLNGAVAFGVLGFLLRLAGSPPAQATGLFAPWPASLVSITSATFIAVFAFTVLRQPAVRSLFRPFSAAPVA